MRTKDKLPFVPAATATRVAYTFLDVAQTEKPHDFVVGLSLLFTQMCRSLELDPSQLINASERRISTDDTFFKREIKAMDDFFKGEFK